MKSELTGYIHHGDGLLTSWKKKCEKKIIYNRKALSGYPKTLRFENKEDIRKYLDNEKLVCLLCGKSYRFLTLHLVVHGHNADSYKEIYGIDNNQGLVGSEIRKKMQKKTIERNRGDLGDAIRNYFEQRILPDKCKCGNELNIHRKCSKCATAYARKSKGYLPRNIAAKTMIPDICKNCGCIIIRSKLGNSKKCYCDSCRKEKYLESQKKYAINNREKRRKMARIARIKRMEKIDKNNTMVSNPCRDSHRPS
jgi:hypothetical protein